VYRKILRIGALVAVLLPLQALATGDPTRPSAWKTKAVAAQNYQLQSVLLSGARRIAFINGKAVSVGDDLGQAQVVSIDRNRVTLRSQGRMIELETGRTRVTRKEQWLLTER
jgi:hypothetical protein